MAVPDVVIRPVTADDHDAWKPLWDGYNAFYGRKGPTALPDDVTQVTWSRFLDGSEPMHALVAEEAEEGRLLGLVHFVLHRSTTQDAPTCYLQDLFTVDEARGRGVGRALIEEVRGRAGAVGSAQVYWHTHESNATARRLYDLLVEPSGFVVYRLPTQDE